MIIMQTEQEFHCAILRFQLRNLSQCINAELLRQLGAERLGQVTHRLKVIDPFHVQPVENLAAAESRLSVIFGPLLQLFQREIIY
ncbi:hypothetical protein D3C86_2092140 [compost metagenome]